MSDNFHIRSASENDYPRIIAMLSALASEEGGICRLDEAALAKQIAFGDPLLSVFSAQFDGVVCGCLLAYPGYDVLSASCGWHLSDFYVEQPYRGKGIGTALLTRLAAEGLKGGKEWISWTVLTANEAAIAFYERKGASPVGVRFMAMGMSAIHRLVARNTPEVILG